MNKFVHAQVAGLFVCGLLFFSQPCVASTAPDMAPGHCRVFDEQLRDDYRGGCRNGLAHGKGSATGKAFYEGNFRAGLKEGTGRWILPNGDLYTGEFKLDLPHGKGYYEWRSDSLQRGNRYLGEFSFGKKQGYGVLLTADGDRYEGRWQDDARVGQTATEIQFQRRYRAQFEAIQPGGVVCRDYPFGIGGTLHVQGRVEDRRGGLLKIKLSQTHRQELALPEMIDNESIMEWLPCL